MPANNSIANDLNRQAAEQVSALTKIAGNSHYPVDFFDHIQVLIARSDFAAKSLRRYPQILGLLADERFCRPIGANLSELRSILSQWIKTRIVKVANEDELVTVLRELRYSALTLITYYDLALNQPIEDSLKQVSVLADELILASYHWLYKSLEQRYGAPQGEHGKQPLCILAMGKLGGYELNFSSDIDMIFVYPQKGLTQGGKKQLENQQFFTRLAQKLIYSLDTVTADGFVYRVDMRLRPFGDSGPLVTHFDALEDYYQEQGREWERYAMIKARLVNPSDNYGNQLSAMLQPFIYRRYIDFTALDSLRSMKLLIEKEVRRKRLTNNIKLGAGGIREVEFLIQSLQLIHAGKYRNLQTQKLFGALEGMQSQQLLEATEAEELKSDYCLLRKVEHCIQQFDDQQTQQLPQNDIDRYRLFTTLGNESWQQCLDQIKQVMARIHEKFSTLIETPEQTVDTTDPIFELCEDLWTIDFDDQEWNEAFNSIESIQLPANQCAEIHTAVAELKQRLQKVTIGERGQKSLGRLIPQLLFDLLTNDQTGVAGNLQQIIPLVLNIAGRTPYLNLLLENKGARKQLIILCSKSPWIADQLSRFPLLLDELLDPSYLNNQSETVDDVMRRFASQLQQSQLRIDPDDLEAMMNSWRQFKLCQQLVIAAADVTEHLPTNKVSDQLSSLANVLVDSVIRYAWRDISKRHGEPSENTIENPGLSIIAYGKFGGLELGYGSDLDLVFLHDAKANTYTNGQKSISTTQFYVKLVQRFLHLMTTPMQLGRVYEIDLRLRPDGNSGMLCSHIESFGDYQNKQAWTWEHQALVRARPVWGSDVLHQRFIEIRKTVLTMPRNTEQLKQAVIEMREKMRSHLLRVEANKVDLKQSIGGITDIEFLVQYWVLAYASEAQSLGRWTDNLRILDEVASAGIASQLETQQLQECYLLLRKEIHRGNLQNQDMLNLSDNIRHAMQIVSSAYQRILG